MQKLTLNKDGRLMLGNVFTPFSAVHRGDYTAIFYTSTGRVLDMPHKIYAINFLLQKAGIYPSMDVLAEDLKNITSRVQGQIGRPRKLQNAKAYTLNLQTKDVELFKKIGESNLSEGVRRATQKAIEQGIKPATPVLKLQEPVLRTVNISKEAGTFLKTLGAGNMSEGARCVAHYISENKE